MKALVIGGAGFIGSTLVDRLLAEGHAVDVIDDLSTGQLTNLAEARADRSAALKIHQVTIASREVVDLVARRAPDVVFHLVPVESIDDVAAFVHVLAGAREGGARKVVLATGWWAEGELSERGAAARSALEYLRLYREAHAVEFVALALSTVYGPRQEHGVVPRLARAALEGSPLTADAATLDLLFVDDAVDAFVRAADRGTGLLVPLGRGVGTTTPALAQLVAEAAGVSPSIERTKGGEGSGAVDPSRARIHLGWEPWTSLEEGVAQTLRWHAHR